jgi:hypothetical protein
MQSASEFYFFKIDISSDQYKCVASEKLKCAITKHPLLAWNSTKVNQSPPLIPTSPAFYQLPNKTPAVSASLPGPF